MITYASLRQQGLRHLEQMTGGRWTDFNTHDPGITLLEQLCYALSDLSYRTEHDIPDLLAEGGADPYASMHTPALILPSRAVTVDDWRRLVLDVDGVQNAWIEPFLETPAAGVAPLRGLNRVLIELSGSRDGTAVRADVGRKLYEHRGLCEDFAEIRVLRTKRVAVNAAIEIGRVDDPSALRGLILDAMAEVISPTIPVTTPEVLFNAGKLVDEIFEGTLPEHGLITDEALARAPRRIAVHSSDLVHAILDIPGVRAVTSLVMSADGVSGAWSLAVPRDEAAQLDRGSSRITLRNAGVAVAAPSSGEAPASPPRPIIDALRSLTPPPGRDRRLQRYASVQRHLPAMYGVGELGLPESATPARKAKAKQLKAYLLVFDQLMANYLAQLAHVKDLFSHDSAPDGAPEKTYFAQPVDGRGIEIDAIQTATPDAIATLAERTDKGFRRKHRFLDHLLARFAENLNDRYEAAGGLEPGADAKLIRDKQAFLRNYPKLSAARGAAYDCLAARDVQSRSGLEDRVRLKLGLVEAKGERVTVIEHILLRPGEPVQLPMVTSWFPPSTVSDYSAFASRLTFVFPGEAGRFADEAFRRIVEQTVRAQTPAHLIPCVAWLDAADWSAFTGKYREWWRQRREHLATILGINLGLDPTLLASITAPLLPGHDDPDGMAPRLIDYNATATVAIQSSQERGARYSLVRSLNQPLSPPEGVLGTGGTIKVTSYVMREDLDVRVQVSRSSDTTILLDAVLPLKVRANAGLVVQAFGSALVPHQGAAAITIKNSQKSVMYSAYVRPVVDDDFFVPPAQPAVLVPDGPGVRVRPLLSSASKLAFVPQGDVMPGNEGDLLLPLGTIPVDSMVIVRAQKTHAASPPFVTDAQLSMAVVFLARPDPAPALQLEVKGDKILVTGGQEGVFYHLYDAVTCAPLGKPVYFHRWDNAANRGIGRLRIGRDLAVTGGVEVGTNRATTRPLSPLVDIGVRPAPRSVLVMARFARTGVEWAAPRLCTIVGA